MFMMAPPLMGMSPEGEPAYLDYVEAVVAEAAGRVALQAELRQLGLNPNVDGMIAEAEKYANAGNDEVAKGLVDDVERYVAERAPEVVPMGVRNVSAALAKLPHDAKEVSPERMKQMLALMERPTPPTT